MEFFEDILVKFYGIFKISGIRKLYCDSCDFIRVLLDLAYRVFSELA